jgi:hypothetical protein
MNEEGDSPWKRSGKSFMEEYFLFFKNIFPFWKNIFQNGRLFSNLERYFSKREDLFGISPTMACKNCHQIEKWSRYWMH